MTIVTTAIGIIATWWFAKATVQSKQFALIELNKFYLYNKPEEKIENLEIKYNGEYISSNFVIFEGAIANNGNVDIILDDTFEMKLSNDSYWESIKSISPQEVEFSIDKNKQLVKIKFEQKKEQLLKVSNYIKFKAFIQLNEKLQIDIDHQIENLRQSKEIYNLNNYSTNLLNANRLKVFRNFFYIPDIVMSIVVGIAMVMFSTEVYKQMGDVGIFTGLDNNFIGALIILLIIFSILFLLTEVLIIRNIYKGFKKYKKFNAIKEILKKIIKDSK